MTGASRIWKDTPEAWEGLVLNEIEKRLSDEEPVLVDGVLRNLSAQGKVNESADIATDLAADRVRVQNIFGVFAELGFISHVDKSTQSGTGWGPYYQLSEVGKRYVEARLEELEGRLPMFKSEEAFNKIGLLDDEGFERVAKVVAPFFQLDYTKRIRLPLADLENIRGAVAAKLTDAMRFQQEELTRLLREYENVPEKTSIPMLIGLPTNLESRFIKERDGMVTCRYRPAYTSMEEAWAASFSQAFGHLKLDRAFSMRWRDNREYAAHFPVEIAIYREEIFSSLIGPTQIGVSFEAQKDHKNDHIKVLRPDSRIWREPVDYQRAGLEKLEQLIEATQNALK